MMDTGRLNEGEILTFARQAKYDEAVAGLALLCKVRFDLIDLPKMTAEVGGQANPFMALSPTLDPSGATRAYAIAARARGAELRLGSEGEAGHAR